MGKCFFTDLWVTLLPSCLGASTCDDSYRIYPQSYDVSDSLLSEKKNTQVFITTRQPYTRSFILNTASSSCRTKCHINIVLHFNVYFLTNIIYNFFFFISFGSKKQNESFNPSAFISWINLSHKDMFFFLLKIHAVSPTYSWSPNFILFAPKYQSVKFRSLWNVSSTLSQIATIIFLRNAVLENLELPPYFNACASRNREFDRKR